MYSCTIVHPLIGSAGMCSTAKALASIPQKAQQQRQSRRHLLGRKAGVCDSEGQEPTVCDVHAQHAGAGAAASDARDWQQHARLRKLPTTGGLTHDVTTSKRRASEKPTDFSKEWKKIAEIFDRLFFCLFFFAFAASTMVLFHPLTMPVRQSTYSTVT